MNRLRLLLSLSTFLVAACGEAPAPRPTLIAHRAGSGYWPENSRTAVLGSIQRHYPGIEVDVTLTKDGVPVLAHDPWLSETLCTTITGAPLPGRVLIQDLMLEELREGYRCGGVQNPDAPEAKVVADTLTNCSEWTCCPRTPGCGCTRRHLG
jgi:glycerophosphoryl diester phosphodiesterase